MPGPKCGNSRRLERLLPFLVCACVVGVSCETRAEEAPDSGPFHIERPDVVMGLLGRYNSSTIRPEPAGQRIKGRDTMLEAYLGASTHGDIKSPDFFQFDLRGTVGLEQLWQRREEFHDDKFRGPYEYDFTGTLLPNSEAPLTLTANRTIEFTSQPFSETYQTTTNSYDAVWTLKSDRVPTEFHLFHNDLTQYSLTGRDDFKTDQNGAEWHTQVIFTPASKLDWNYSYSNISQTDPHGKLETFDTHTATLVHSYEFGDRRQNSLNSTLDVMDQEGAFAQQHVWLGENLLLKHNDRVETFYEYQFQDTSFPDVDTTLNRLKAGIRDKVLTDLLVTGSAGGLTQEQGGSETDELFGQVNLDYNRKVPFGLLSWQGEAGTDYQSNQAQQAEAHVVQAVAFGPSQDVVVARNGIRGSSVGVRNAAGTRIFTQGFDYLTSYHGNRLVIQRIPGGAIPANSSILLDFDVIPKPANDVTTNHLATGLRYDMQEGWLKGLGLYTHYLYQHQEIATDRPGAFVPDNIDEAVYGAEYRIWKLRFTAEHEDHHGELVPFSSDRYSARYEDRIASDWRILADATQVRTMYQDDKTNPVATTVSASLEYKPSRAVSAGFTLAYLHLDDDLTTHAWGLEESIDLKWAVRETTIKGQVRHSRLDTDTEESSAVFFMLSVERRF